MRDISSTLFELKNKLTVFQEQRILYGVCLDSEVCRK